jgi:hypothetical protein
MWRAGGDGWSAPPMWRDDVAVTVYVVLIAVAIVLISLAVLDRERPSWLVATLAALSGLAVAGLAYVSSPSETARPDPVALAGALMLPAAALIVLFAATGAALARRRFLLAAGLLPLVVGGMGAVFAVSGLGVLHPAPDGCSGDCRRMTRITLHADAVAVSRVPGRPQTWTPPPWTPQPWTPPPWTPPPSTAVPPDPVELPSSGDFWSGPIDWARTGSAVGRTLLLLCLGVLTTSLVPEEGGLRGPGRWIPGR